MRRAFDPPHRTRKPARSFDDSLAQSGLYSEQRRERRAAGDLGHFLLELDDSISDFLALPVFISSSAGRLARVGDPLTRAILAYPEVDEPIRLCSHLS